MTKERMKELLIIAMLPFLVVAYETTDWSFLSAFNGSDYNCDVYHANAKPGLRCEVFESREGP